jgi:DNA helicase II / ATP-dependent DNA helicase PcrA
MLNAHDNTTLVIGPPGTGKTTKLISIMEECLSKDIAPDRIGFVSFSKAAAEEAKKRVMNKFNLLEKELPYFRTIHSFCFRQLGLSRDSILTKEHEQEFGDLMGLDIKGNQQVNDGMYGMNPDDRYLFIENQSRIRKQSLRQTWEDIGDDETDWYTLERVQKSLVAYKNSNLLLDFTDIITRTYERDIYPRLDVLFVDEAQDLSAVQWDIIDSWSKHVKQIFIAGDDDQAIHAWAGADVNRFIGVNGKKLVLNQSYRIPSSVHKVSSEIISNIHTRIPKTFSPRQTPGQVEYFQHYEHVDISKGEWLILARNSYSLNKISQHCETEGFSYSHGEFGPLKTPAFKAIVAYEKLRRGQGISSNEAKLVAQYMTGKTDFKMIDSDMNQQSLSSILNCDYSKIWHEALVKIPDRTREFFIAARRRGEPLAVGKPRIKLSTIHGAKGSECDNVMLLTDISQKTVRAMDVCQDNEHRVFYVGVTRARQNLSVIMPSTKHAYNI